MYLILYRYVQVVFFFTLYIPDSLFKAKNFRTNKIMEKQLIKQTEKIENLHKDGFKIIQDGKRFKFGIDAVLLADFAKARKTEYVIDLGTGTGIIPILMAADKKGGSFSALEIQKESVDMAKRSVLLNNLQEKITVIHGDIKNAGTIFPAQCADSVTCNPPYICGQADVQQNESIAIARHELLCSLEDVVYAAKYLLKPQGRFYIIHRPERLSDLCVLLAKHNVNPKRMRFVQPYTDSAPTMILVEARKAMKPQLSIEKPLVIYKEKGVYTEEVSAIYGKSSGTDQL